MIQLDTENIYSVCDFENLLKQSLDHGKCYKSKKINYYNSICAFDIETSNIKNEQDIYQDIYLYNYLKNTDIRLLDSEVPKISGLHFSRTKGINIDEFYTELHDVFPDWFPDSYDESEQVNNIIKAYIENKPNEDADKFSIMYCWQFAIDGKVIFGRTWDEFLKLIEIINKYVDIHNRIIVFVHNLSFEMQFIRKLLTWHKVFSIAARKPIYAITESGIEFRCSYILTNYSLAKLSDQLHHYKIHKLDTLNYDLIRTPATPMTLPEIKYAIYDTLVVSAYIQECVMQEKYISRIPLTATGYCRRYTRKMCFYSGKDRKEKQLCRASYKALMACLTIDGKDEYLQLKRAFQGGFTHANAWYSGILLNNVHSIDFTSSYPYSLLSEQYPMSKGKKVRPKNKEEFEHYLKYYCCIFDVEFIDIESTFEHENYISISHCFVKEKPVTNNGRLVSAKRIVTTLTEIDFDIINKTYKYKHAKVKNMRIYRKGYLPKNLILSIIKLYQDKTQLKGVEGKEVEYLNSKALLNSVFGMMVTDISKDEIIYTDSWDILPADIEKDIEKYNNSNQRFLFYPWGVYCTAYSRRNLYYGIMHMTNKDGTSDYVYSDTDSIKLLNYEAHKYYIDWYNRQCEKKLKAMCKFHDIDYQELLPRTIKGKVKPLGVWDYEGCYSRFKTLGAKRYMVEHDGEINITVAGVNKFVAVPYLINKYGNDIFDAFNMGLDIPPEHTGKLTHVYIDSYQTGSCTDYLGKCYEFTEQPPGVFLEKAPYYFDISQDYINYIKGVQFQK